MPHPPRFAPPLSRRRVLSLLGVTVALPRLALGQTGTLSDDASDGTADADADALVEALLTPWTGDLDGIVERGYLRIGTGFNPFFFHYNKADQRGLMVDVAARLEAHLRKALGKPARGLTVAIAPVGRAELIPALLGGRIDMISAMMTVTPEREKLVAFSDPTIEDVAEVVVTGPAAPPVASLDDLVATGVALRRSSSYFEHLAAINAERSARGSAAIPVTELDDELEDPDVAELIAAGSLPAGIFDDHMARLYAEVFEGLTIHDGITVATGGRIAMAVRPDAPALLAQLNAFIPSIRKGSLVGNMLRKQYFGDATAFRNALDPADSARFRETIAIIRKYADQYEFDAILIAAQGFQESRLDQRKRSPVGAVGIMQVMPATARDPNVAIPNISVADRNVEAGVKYLRFLRDHYFSDPAMSPLDQALFSFAAYNAGPGNISKARKRAVKMGLDPNRWFGSVEIAAGRVVSREPVVYVRNILKYYTAYRIYATRLDNPGE
ncbi:transporter substrate-binding domain-containing protein [Limibaculum sp. FT325]|uniref:transporter substrate-binding domain-containing protein n=1 Tax=Thermohalobaculum sediminis TaxID=2939436 RepID=UPI0020BE8127|nr:transporter substrate-binding domain-containing protein [Limibaculum sediminis]MCL5775419.1 transporter substrate-binding domain-containing protein [Limibaculum sediminis]